MENLSNASKVSNEINKMMSELLKKRKEHKLTQQEELDYYALHTLSMSHYGTIKIEASGLYGTNNNNNSQGVIPTYSDNYIRKVEL